MPLLDRHGEKTDVWTRIETACEAPEGDHVLAFFSELDALLLQSEPGRHIGVFIPNKQSVDSLKPYLDQLALIVIHFPSATDGRGFSLARQIRQQGFAGTLRASGPLIADQFPQALACGFDEVEISPAHAARQPVEQWLAAANRISLAYQQGYDGAENIYESRRAQRAASAV